LGLNVTVTVPQQVEGDGAGGKGAVASQELLMFCRNCGVDETCDVNFSVRKRNTKLYITLFFITP